MRLGAKRTMDDRAHSASWCWWRWFDIWKDGEIYLTRLVILRTPWFQILMHWIHKPDEDAGMHDHPWWFVGFVLDGEYIEKRAEIDRNGKWLHNLRNKTVRFLIRQPLNRAHQIVMTSSHRVITLLLTGPKAKSWGFYTHDVSRRTLGTTVPVHHTPWREFLDLEAVTPTLENP